ANSSNRDDPARAQHLLYSLLEPPRRNPRPIVQAAFHRIDDVVKQPPREYVIAIPAAKPVLNVQGRAGRWHDTRPLLLGNIKSPDDADFCVPPVDRPLAPGHRRSASRRPIMRPISPYETPFATRTISPSALEIAEWSIRLARNTGSKNTRMKSLLIGSP